MTDPAPINSATLVGGLHGSMPVLVDQAGLILLTDADWSLEWWIGGDDRWYFPTREAAVRQRRVGVGPVVETSMRIPSGDAVATVYGARSSGNGGRASDVAVVEIANRSPVPVALALAIRSHRAGGNEPGIGAKLALVDETTVAIGDSHVLSLPRPPSGSASSAEADLSNLVERGDELDGFDPVGGPGTNAVVMYPLPHGTTLRFCLEHSSHDASVEGPTHPDSLADAEQVSRGWSSVVGSQTRLSTPDSGVDVLLDAGRARLLIDPRDGLGELDHVVGTGESGLIEGAPKAGSSWRSRRRRPPSRPSCNSGAGDLVAALAVGGHFDDVERLVTHLADNGVSRLSSPEAGARLVAGCSLASALWLAVDSDRARPCVELALESLTAVTSLVERSSVNRVSRKSEPPADTQMAFSALGLVTQMLGQDDAAAGLRQRIQGWTPTSDPTVGLGRVGELAGLNVLGEQASEARSWPPDETDCGLRCEIGSPTRADSASSAARYVLAARGTLIAEDLAGVVELLPGFPTAWRGGQVEVHDAPTLYGRLSFAVRWHGPRPALLWDLSAAGPLADRFVGLRCSALDPDWTGGVAAGETLLAGSDQGLGPAPAPGDSFS